MDTSNLTSTSASASLPYHEPDIVTILILSSFLLTLNALNHILDSIIYCGLIGQILIGIAWGTPGGQLLGVEAEQVIVNLGYLGLILLVYQGGISTSFKALKSNAFLSIGVALTGISLPIALSYILLKLTGATSIQAFAAGAALCSTSLGTTFAVLGTSGLVKTRMGVVLSTAAMLDDVVGLVMVRVISNLGSTNAGGFSSVTVIRPVFVSLAFAIFVPLLAWLLVKPMTLWLNEWREGHTTARINKVMESQHFAVTCHTLVLLAMVTGSSYAGTSNLFAAYLAGALISWWDTEMPHPILSTSRELDPSSSNVTSRQVRDDEAVISATSATSGAHTFETFYQQALQRILKPFFFASIGFSIPITQMFQGSIIWRGIVYTVLMLIGKLACGLWLTRLPNFSFPRLKFRTKTMMSKTQKVTQPQPLDEKAQSQLDGPLRHQLSEGQSVIINKADREEGATRSEHLTRSSESRKLRRRASTQTDSNPESKCTNSHQTHPARKPLSLYPPLIVGCAMTARGEIGFLISSLAQSNGIFNSTSNTNSDDNHQNTSPPIFLIVTWAIMLCTILGPVCVGLLVRRVKELENGRQDTNATRERDVLGDWGVE